ncbi:LysR family transcriptional regulator, chromosome initiation inhibitor [Rhizobium sp. RU20A]|uniref:LysR family transcriptional regulator ArgP n=1 Tax=Rhizobium sp. RU20A TaxID=1907412 RepID=UPI0009571BAD|nr:LysR family transcriptional regulator ArgP [Rhizobium sp. RU20A]SIR31528.1 LysR family transcriptional regulator, chromosome initiation inhibitor [Rhizobium sp. RU20A]
MIDYAALRAVSAVVETGSFEKAARLLNITPSAVSQRVKQIEDRLGTVLIVRGNPCRATENGDWLCRHMETVGLLEADLMERLPALRGVEGSEHRVTVSIAANADSLATWFLVPLAAFGESSAHLVHLSVDDEDHTAQWLQRGAVLAAVTSLEKPVPGCRHHALGKLRYRATASPDFLRRYFPDGVNAEALARAPCLTFSQKDRLQARWMEAAFGREMAGPTHCLPSTHAFVEASLAGMGWGMNPETLVTTHLQSGSLVELIAEAPLDIPLFWQINRLTADRLDGLTRAVLLAARQALLR